eukprot:5391557-Karenia_brevis.AAC.1
MTTPSEEGGKRLAEFHSWYDSAAAGKRLRVASICLQLITYAVNIASQKSELQPSKLPTIIRLSQGE